MQIKDTEYCVFLAVEGGFHVYFHRRYGQGRNARRKLTTVIFVPWEEGRPTGTPLLRALADALDKRSAAR